MQLLLKLLPIYLASTVLALAGSGLIAFFSYFLMAKKANALVLKAEQKIRGCESCEGEGDKDGGEIKGWKERREDGEAGNQSMFSGLTPAKKSLRKIETIAMATTEASTTLSTVLDNILCGIIILSNSGSVLVCNKLAAEITGHKEDAPPLFFLTDPALYSKIEKKENSFVLKKIDQSHYCITFNFILDKAIIVLTDVTERESALDDKDKILKKVVNGISTPAKNIVTNAEMIYLGMGVDATKSCAETIKEDGRKIIDVIKHLLID